jgi:hypothetical protein
MKRLNFPFYQQKQSHLLLYVVSILLLVALSCNVSTTGSSGDQSLVQTQTSLNVQLTMSSMNESQGQDNGTEQALQSTQVAQNAQATVLAQQSTLLAQPTMQPTVDIAATQVAISAQATTNAQQPIPNAQNPPPAQNPGGQVNPADFNTWMQGATILLFEDMAGQYDVTRSIQMALDSMGLEYQDDKDAQGNFKSDILMGGPGGQPWDLIISGSERRDGIQGEFFDMFGKALNNGSSVIVELWNIDSFVIGKVSPLLAKCGVRFMGDWFAIGAPIPDSEQVLYPYDGTNLILHEPNEGIRISNPNQYWWNWMWFWGWGIGDYGDFLEKLPGSKATIVLGQKNQDKTRYATLVSCLDGQFTVQTFSTHSYGQDRVIPLWINMITQALKARYVKTH